MSLKRLLGLVTVLGLVAPASINVVACGSSTNTPSQTNLGIINEITGVVFNFNPDDKFSDFDSLFAKATEFEARPITHYTVTYWDASTDGNEITGNTQVSGTVYVVITADISDANWTGSTSNSSRISITVADTRTNLDTVSDISDLTKSVNDNAVYSTLDSIIKTSTAFATKPLDSYTVTYWDAASAGNEITNNFQVAGTVYVVVTANSDDLNWTGSTSNYARLHFDLDKVNLSTITTLTGLNITVNTGQNFSALNATIAGASQFNSHPLAVGYTIQYWDAVSAGNNVTNSPEVGGVVYVVITADSSDPYWTGTTSRLAVTINKVNLSTITTLTGLSITVDTTKKYSDLNATIAGATQFTTHPLAVGYTMQYFAAVSGGSSISNNNQVGGTVYVVITAAANDPYWTGATSNTARIAVIINKVNLSTITTLTGLNFVVNTAQTYSILDVPIATATEFSTHPLTAGYTVNWYAAASGGSSINNNNQAGGTVYVVITAAVNDPYWGGTTSNTARIAVTINKINLSTVTSLSGLNITVDTSQTYSALDVPIATATEFSTHPLAVGYTIDWYAAASGGSNIDTNNQAGGTVYVVITAAVNDPYWGGTTSNTARIAVTINKINLSTVTSLSGLNITADTGQAYSALDATIATATEFTTHPLVVGYSINWFAAASGGSNINSSNQTSGTVYVVVIAAVNDPYWTGSTSNTTRIAVNLGAFSLMTGTAGKISSVATDTDGNTYSGSDNGTVYKLPVGSSTFTPMTGITGKVLAVTTDKDKNIYASNDGGKIFRCLVGQTNFGTTIGGTISGNIQSLSWGYDTADVYGYVFGGSSTGQVYFSLNGTDDVFAESGSAGDIKAVVSPNNDRNMIYAVSTNGKAYRWFTGRGAFDDIPGASENFLSLAADSSGANVFAGGTSGNIYQSVTAGALTTFTQITTGLTEPINSITIANNGDIWVGTINNKVYRSTNGGTVFQLMTGVTGAIINALSHDSTGNIYAGTDDGFFKGK